MNYFDNDIVQLGNRSGMNIQHLSYASLCSSDSDTSFLLHIFCMFLPLIKILLVFLNLHVTIMCSLNFIVISALLKIKLPRRYFSKETYVMAYMFFSHYTNLCHPLLILVLTTLL